MIRYLISTLMILFIWSDLDVALAYEDYSRPYTCVYINGVAHHTFNVIIYSNNDNHKWSSINNIAKFRQLMLSKKRCFIHINFINKDKQLIDRYDIINNGL